MKTLVLFFSIYWNECEIYACFLKIKYVCAYIQSNKKKRERERERQTQKIKLTYFMITRQNFFLVFFAIIKINRKFKIKKKFLV